MGQLHGSRNDQVGCNTVEYSTAFLHSDYSRLYFLWHSMKTNIIVTAVVICPES